MTRPRANLQVTFADVLPLWEQVLEHNGVSFTFATRHEAIACAFRMNLYRKRYREQLTEDDMSVYDRFILRNPHDENLRVEPRLAAQPRATSTLKGTPLKEEPPLSLDDE